MEGPPAYLPPVSITEEINSLADSLRLFAKQHERSSGFRQLVENVADQLSAAARDGESYDAAQEVIRINADLIDLLGSALHETAAALQRFEQVRLKRRKHSADWREQTVAKLGEAFRQDREKAFVSWVTTYADAVVDWQLDTCELLLKADFPHPRGQLPYALLLKHGHDSLRKKDYQPSLKMLQYLVQTLSQTTSEHERILASLLSIFAGRIQLYQMKEPALAREAFAQAATLVPTDGRPLAAQGQLALAQEESSWGEANRLFSRAVEYSPREPEGYVGKAMLAEARQQWPEADQWYKTAVRESLDEPDLFQFLSKLLAPGSGRLYLHVGRELFSHNDLTSALEAVERGLQLGIKDGTDYPLRSLIGLKADVLRAAREQNLPSEDPKAIAALYEEAGKYCYWTNEYQTAAELLRKGRALDSQSPIIMYRLADTLRVLADTYTPPYYSNPESVRESRDVWEDAYALRQQVTSTDAWIYVARSRIAKQLALLPAESETEHYWHSIVLNEQALLLSLNRSWWTELAGSYNGLSLYANMFNVLQKTEQDNSDDLFALQEKAKVLVNTGQIEEAQSAIEQLMKKSSDARTKAVYRGWQAVLDFYKGNYAQALDNLKPTLEETPDDLWTVALQANTYFAKGDTEKAVEIANWIWAQREDPKYKSFGTDFARAAYLKGMYSEALQRLEPFLLSQDPDQRIDAHLQCGLAYLALGDFTMAEKHLAAAVETSNRRRMIDIILDLEQLRRRAQSERWPDSDSIVAYVDKAGSPLSLVRSKLKETKAFEADPVKELETVLADPVTGQPGSWSWLAVQAGLGRLHLEAGRRDLATKAYEQLARHPDKVRESAVALNNVRARK